MQFSPLLHNSAVPIVTALQLSGNSISQAAVISEMPILEDLMNTTFILPTSNFHSLTDDRLPITSNMQMNARAHNLTLSPVVVVVDHT